MNYSLLLLSFGITFFMFIPFIGLLYKLKLRDRGTARLDAQGKKTPIFSSLKKSKEGTPTGGGILIVVLGIIMTLVAAPGTLGYAVALSLGLFGFIGFIDDLYRIGNKRVRLLGLGLKTKFVLQIVFGIILALYLESVTNSLTLIPGLIAVSGVVQIILVTLTIVFVSNAFNISDGVDGLSIGLFIVMLLGISLISSSSDHISSIIAILVGSSLAYLYFNIPPARVFMGDTGSIGLGSIITVLLVLEDKFYLLPLLCLPIIVEAFSSLLQLLSKKFLGRKLFPIAPFHHLLEYRGWAEATVTMRFWLIGVLCMIVTVVVNGLTNGSGG